MASVTERKRSNTVIGKLLNMWLDQSTQRANNNHCSILWVFKTVIMKVRADSRHKLKDQRFTTAGRKDREYIIPLDKFELSFSLNCMVSGLNFLKLGIWRVSHCILKRREKSLSSSLTHSILFRDKNRFWVPREAAVLTIQSELLFLLNQSTTRFNSWGSRFVWPEARLRVPQTAGFSFIRIIFSQLFG